MRAYGGTADTVDLGSTAKAWGFESLQVHQSRQECRGKDLKMSSIQTGENMV